MFEVHTYMPRSGSTSSTPHVIGLSLVTALSCHSSVSSLLSRLCYDLLFDEVRVLNRQNLLHTHTTVRACSTPNSGAFHTTYARGV